jgi:hypothetical protein
MELVATLGSIDTTNAKNLADKKETVRRWLGMSVIEGEISTRIDVRWYMSRSADGAGPLHCSIWVWGIHRRFAGYGIANGYGYDKYSASLASAIKSAGIKLDKSIDGVGESAVRAAMVAIGEALGMTITVIE